MKIFSGVLGLLIFLLVGVSSVSAASYYVSTAGLDTNPGTIDRPWKSLTKANQVVLQPGDSLLFARGGEWTGSGAFNSAALTIANSGTETNPITIGAYGTGVAPIIRNPSTTINHTQGIRVSSSWVVVENFKLRDVHDSGVQITPTASHVIVRNNEITNTGFGVSVSGAYHKVDSNYIHDLHIIVNTVGGNDDYGAVGVDMSFASNSEISNNKMLRCMAPSYDFVSDGGVVEWWGNSDNNYVHHNWGELSDGFFEVGGSAGNHAFNNIVAYNVSLNNGKFSHVHVEGAFGMDSSFRVENNTIIETQPHSPLLFAMLTFSGTATDPASYSLQNNIFYLGDVQYISPADSRLWVFKHQHNIYQLLKSQTQVGFALDSTEQLATIGLNNPGASDFHLTANSPAIDVGVNLGWFSDFEKKLVPQGTKPDLGAYEYSSTQRIGDLNADGLVDLADLGILLPKLTLSVPSGGVDGDFNVDTKVNMLDFGLWLTNRD